MLVGCISEQERFAAHQKLEDVLETQCEQKMGFQKGTQAYMQCRTFYDGILQEEGFSSDYYGLGTVLGFENKIDEANEHCATLWGNMPKRAAVLWPCVQERLQADANRVIHERELREQRQMYKGAAVEANNDIYLKERIDAEREKVSKETGKSPSKINCRTYPKSNGYVQIKCK